MQDLSADVEGNLYLLVYSLTASVPIVSCFFTIEMSVSFATISVALTISSKQLSIYLRKSNDSDDVIVITVTI